MVLSTAWPVCFPWLGSFCWVQRTALLGFLSFHFIWSVSFCCQVCLGKFYFPKLTCHFCLWRNFMSSPHLIRLTIFLSSDSGLLLCPQVIFFKIKVHHTWLPQLEGVRRRQILLLFQNRTFCENSVAKDTSPAKRTISLHTCEWDRYVCSCSPLYGRNIIILPHAKHSFSFWRSNRALLSGMRLRGRSVSKCRPHWTLRTDTVFQGWLSGSAFTSCLSLPCSATVS